MANIVRLGPLRKGFAGAVGGILFLSTVLTACATISFGPPSAGLMWTLAQVGVGFLIAYSVALASAEKDLSRKGTREQHESWLGFVVGCGSCGLAGIGAALATASHLHAGHAGVVDEIGLWWSISSIGMLGVLIAALPIVSYRWRTD